MSSRKKLLNAGMALALVCGLSVPMVAQAQQAMQHQIVVGQATGATLPRLNVPAGQDVVFHVVNPTEEPVFFMIPQLSTSYIIGPESEKTLLVDISPVQDYELTYQINDAEGNLLAYGDIVNTGSIEVALVDIEQRIATVEALDLITMRGLGDPDPQPVYVTPAPAAVRGFW